MIRMKKVEFNIANFTEFKHSYKREVIQNNIGKTKYEIDVILEEMYIAYINKELNVNVSTLEDAVKVRHYAQMKEYRAANKDKLVAQRKEYRAANKEKLAARQKGYYAANKEKVAAQQKEYRAANKDKRAAYMKEYYAANKDKLAAYHREYYARKKEEKKKK